jgi:hypothetical protein
MPPDPGDARSLHKVLLGSEAKRLGTYDGPRQGGQTLAVALAEVRTSRYGETPVAVEVAPEVVPQEFVRQEVGSLQFERFAGHDSVTGETFDDLRGPKVEHAGDPRVRVGFSIFLGRVVPQGMVAVEVRFEF